MRSEKVINMTDLKASSGFRLQPAECEEHGPFEQRVTLAFGREYAGACPACSAAQKQHRADKEAAERAQVERDAMARKLGDALIPKRFAGKRLADYKVDTPAQAKALEVCTRYVKAFDEILETGRCLAFLGTPGTGKTHLGVSIANELMANTSASAVYRTMGSVLQSIRATYSGGDRTEADILKSLITPSLLVLDEIGVSKDQPSDFELTTLFSIINGRYEQMLPTVVISNLTAKELPNAMGERCVDRLKEGGMYVVLFDWASKRGTEGF